MAGDWTGSPYPHRSSSAAVRHNGRDRGRRCRHIGTPFSHGFGMRRTATNRGTEARAFARGWFRRMSPAFVAVAAAAAVASPAHAGKLLLSGTVPPKCSIAISAGGSANFADLSHGIANAFLATISEKCVAPAFHMTIRTMAGAAGHDNSAQLRAFAETDERLSYSLRY